LRAIQKIVVYGSLGIRPGLSELLWAFRRSHRLEEFPVYLDDHPFQLVERIKAEQSHGMKTADVVLMPHYMLLGLERSEMLGKLRTKGMPMAKSSVWSPVGVTFMGMAYDSKRIPKKDLPSSLAELLDQKRVRLGTQSLTASKAGNLGVHYLSFLKGKVGERKWRSFVESLVKARPKAYDCIDHLLQGLQERELDVAMTVYSLAYFRVKQALRTLKLLGGGEMPLMRTFTSVGVLKVSEGNESAQAFVEFLLSEEAQKIIGRIPGIAPAMAGIRPSYDFECKFDQSSEFHPMGGELDEVAKSSALFRGLGLP
jgi:ABC-type thiamine transport system substrate-binding protein